MSNYFFRFRVNEKIKARELERFLRKTVEIKALNDDYFSAVSFFKYPEQIQHFGRGFTVEDERLKGAALPTSARIYDHDPVAGTVMLRPKAGLVLAFEKKGDVVLSLGFLRFASTIRNVWGKVLGNFEFGHDWVFQGHLSRPHPRVLKLIAVFGDWGYLDELSDADFESDECMPDWER